MMNYKWIFLFISIISFSITVPAQVQNKSFSRMLKVLLSDKVPQISVKDAEQNATSFMMLDAREKEEFNVSHLRNARLIGYKNFNVLSLADISKNKPLVVYCSIGKRSQDITSKLQKAGYTNVRNLYGGIFEWVNQGNPVFNNEQKPTTKVHAYSKFWGTWLQKGEKVY